MKETAVEWLEKIRQAHKEQPFDDYEWKIAFNYAKKIEKQQIVDAWFGGYLNGEIKNGLASENYYNKTYKKTDK